MTNQLDADHSENADVPAESESETQEETTSRKDYFLLILVTLIKLGDSVEVYLPGVITQKASCELEVSDSQEGLLAVIFYLFYAAAILVSCPISSRLGERLTMILSLYLSIVFAILCAIVPNYYTLLLSRALTGICVGLNASVCGIFFAKFASSKQMLTEGSFLFEALSFPVGGTWVSILGWLFLDLVGWRVFVLLTSIPLFVPPIIMLHFFFREPQKLEHNESQSIEDTHPDESSTLLDSKEVPNFTARVSRSSMFMFCNLCVGYSTIILAPSLIRIYKTGRGAPDDVNDTMVKCFEVVQGKDFLILSVVTGISNFIGRILGISLWGRVKFLFLQSTATVIVALSFGILLLEPSIIVSMVFLGISQFFYSIQGVEAAALRFDYDYYGTMKFELGTCVADAVGMIGAVVGTSLSAFLDPYIALIVLLVVACCEIVLICFMRERF